MADVEEIKRLASDLIKEMFVEHRKVMLKWKDITHQSPQLDSGYISQHLISLLTGKNGSGTRGKGLDLDDGSEVKSACSIDGIDRPRWNHSFRKLDKIDTWLASPNLYYVLFDQIKRNISPVRVRIWMITPGLDKAYQTVLRRWGDLPDRTWAKSTSGENNFQLHPPLFGKAINKATNECGDLDLPLMFWAEENETGLVTIKFFQQTGLPASTLIERSDTPAPRGKNKRSTSKSISYTT